MPISLSISRTERELYPSQWLYLVMVGKCTLRGTLRRNPDLQNEFPIKPPEIPYNPHKITKWLCHNNISYLEMSHEVRYRTVLYMVLSLLQFINRWFEGDGRSCSEQCQQVGWKVLSHCVTSCCCCCDQLLLLLMWPVVVAVVVVTRCCWGEASLVGRCPCCCCVGVVLLFVCYICVCRLI